MILPTEKRRELLARLRAAGPSTVEELAAALSWTSSAVTVALRTLELEGIARRVEPLPPFAPRAHSLARRVTVPRWTLAAL